MAKTIYKLFSTFDLIASVKFLMNMSIIALNVYLILAVVKHVLACILDAGVVTGPGYDACYDLPSCKERC
jgi:hypothetical protein